MKRLQNKIQTAKSTNFISSPATCSLTPSFGVGLTHKSQQPRAWRSRSVSLPTLLRMNTASLPPAHSFPSSSSPASSMARGMDGQQRDGRSSTGRAQRQHSFLGAKTPNGSSPSFSRPLLWAVVSGGCHAGPLLLLQRAAFLGCLANKLKEIRRPVARAHPSSRHPFSKACLSHSQTVIQPCTVCGLSMMEQVRLCAVWPTEILLTSSMNHIQG